jgi:hypothetical protein
MTLQSLLIIDAQSSICPAQVQGRAWLPVVLGWVWMGCSKHCWWCGAGLSDFYIDFIERCIGIINVSEYILNTQTGLSNTF